MAYDVVVVGGSFAGLSAALQLVRARRRVLIVDAGMPRNRFSPAAHGFLTQDGTAPRDFLAQAARQVAAYPTAELARGEVVQARALERRFAVTLGDGREETAARLVLATGVHDELPAVPGLEERWGRSVLHCPYCHGYEVRDRPLGILATHAMTPHKALLLPDWGPTTYFTHGGFAPDAEQAARLSARGIQVESSPIVELLGPEGALEAVRLEDGRVLPLAALFVTPRSRPASPLAAQLGCAIDEGPMGPYVRVDDWKATTVPGVYAAGDTATPMHSITLATAAGALAGVGAHQSLALEIPAR